MEVRYLEVRVPETDARVVAAIADHPAVIVGFASWHDQTLEVVRVSERFRRQGHATRLVQLADELSGYQLKDSGERTPEGTKLLQNMGRRLTRITTRASPNCGTTMMFVLQSMLADGLINPWRTSS